MAHCPKCRSELDASAERCDKCLADFSGPGWKPVTSTDASPATGEGTSAAAVLFWLGVSSVVLPFLGWALGILFAAVMPGCHCDAGAGCPTCAMGGMLEVLIFGGFVVGMGAAVTVLPGCFVLAALFALVSRH